MIIDKNLKDNFLVTNAAKRIVQRYKLTHKSNIL